MENVLTRGKKGATYKEGNPCKKCGDTRKYSSYACVNCSINRSKKFYHTNKSVVKNQNKERYEDKYREQRGHTRKCDIVSNFCSKEYNRVYYKTYWKNNPIQKAVRNTLRRTLSDWKGGRKKSEEILGYTFEQLQKRIEVQFRDGMSWDNYGEWHIDHKKPIKRFIDQGEDNPRIINSLCNLQPLWKEDNLKKGATFTIKDFCRHDK